MAIIDPEGLFSGERLAACSDIAQFCWPRFFLAANSCGRIELSYKSLVSRVFGNFLSPPKSDELWAIFREYDENFLAILYQSESGTWWCQFVTSEKYLPKYKKTRDSMSPAPPIELVEFHNRGYLEWKKSKSFQNQSFQKFPEPSESSGSEGVGIGVGIGVGGGIGEIQNTSRKTKKVKVAPDPRHTPFKELLVGYWKYKNPKNPEMPWGPADAGQLGKLLAESPNMTAVEFREFLHNRARSDVAHGDRVSKWLGNITKFSESLDQFGKPKSTNGGKNAPISQGRGQKNVGVLEEFINDTERRSDANQNGNIPAGDHRQSDTETLHGVSGGSRPQSLPSSDAEPLDF